MKSEHTLTLADLAVVLVEPSSTQQHIIVNHLRKMGIKNIVAQQDAASTLASFDLSVPDLVISAMHLPDITGTELAQRLREDPRTLDVLFMLISSETAYRYIDPLKQAGVVAILPKPFQPDDLQKALNTTLDFMLPDEDLDESVMDEIRVLVVDDSLTSRHHIKRVLHNMGITHVVEADNGRDALVQVKTQFFDLIVTDYNMPEMDGQQLAQYVREQSTQRSIPILMVTSVSNDPHLAQVLHSGVSAICDKPFEPSGIKNLVRKLLTVG